MTFDAKTEPFFWPSGGAIFGVSGQDAQLRVEDHGWPFATTKIVPGEFCAAKPKSRVHFLLVTFLCARKEK